MNFQQNTKKVRKMQEFLPMLRRSPLFVGIDDADIQKMLNCLGAQRISFDRRRIILCEGIKPTRMGLVLSGTVLVERVDHNGNRSILQEIGAGGLFGETFACAGADSLPVTIVAGERSEVLLLDAVHVLHTCHHHCGHHQAMIFNLMKELARKNMEFHDKIEITSRRTTREKLLSYLDICAKKEGKRKFLIPFDRQELADYLEVDRSGLSAEIGKLRRERILLCRKNEFELL